MKNIEQTPTYSIIIPHRNVPDLLRRLLHSIPIREDVEVVVVDDSSNQEFQSDINALESEYKTNAHFIYLDSCHGGGYARNVGLENVNGKWILFADADDYFNYCINDILDEYQNCDADIVFFNANSLDCYLYTTVSRVDHLNCFIKEYNKTQNELLLRYKFSEPWCKMVKRKLISENNIQFEEISIHNDAAYSYLVGYYAKKIKVDNRALYCVTYRDNSVSKGINLKKKLERIGVFARSSRFFKSHAINVSERRHFKLLLELKFEDRNVYKQAFEMLQQYGYSSQEIRIGLLKQIFFNIYEFPYKCANFIIRKLAPVIVYKTKIRS